VEPILAVESKGVVQGKLALDLGGVHGVESATIDFDAKAADLGITQGKSYTIEVLQSERHTNSSHFRRTSVWKRLLSVSL